MNRANYIKTLGWTHQSLADRVGCCKKTVARWSKGDGAEAHKEICKALDVHEDFFEALEEFTKAYKEAWDELQSNCPKFYSQLRLLAEVGADAEDTKVLTNVFDDLDNHRGALILQPALSELDTLVATEAQLNAIEKFVGFLFLASVDPDHQLVVNVNSSNLMRLGGVSREYVARMLVHLGHAKRMGPIKICLDNGEISDSPYTATFNAVESAEKADEEGVEEFMSGLRSGLNLKEYALSLSPMTGDQQTVLAGTSTNIYAGLDAEIYQLNYTNKSRLAIARESTSDSCANSVNQRLPSLRVFKYDRGASRDFLKYGEHEVDALVRITSLAIQKRREQFTQSEGDYEMAKNVFNINAPSQLNTGKHAQGNMQVDYNESLNEAKKLLLKVASELFLEGREELAREAKEIAKESNQDTFLQRAKQLVEDADVYLGASVNIATLTPLLATLIGVGGA